MKKILYLIPLLVFSFLISSQVYINTHKKPTPISTPVLATNTIKATSTPEPEPEPTETPEPEVDESSPVIKIKLDQYTNFFKAHEGVVNIDIKNPSENPIDNWILKFDLNKNNKIFSPWNADISQKNNTVTVKPKPYNKTIHANSSLNFGFKVTSRNQIEVPGNFLLNDIICRLE